MVASQPARQRRARRNQRCFCCLARWAERRPRAGSATFFTPSSCASRSFLVGKKTSVGGSHLRRSSEARLLLLEGRHPGGGIVRVAGQNLVTAHDAVFHLVNPHQPTKLVGLVRFPFANDFGVRFEQAQHFAFHVTVSTPHSFLGLRDYLLDQREKVPQLADLCFYPQELAHYFQPSLPPSLHHFAGLSHHASGQLH